MAESSAYDWLKENLYVAKRANNHAGATAVTGPVVFGASPTKNSRACARWYLFYYLRNGPGNGSFARACHGTSRGAGSIESAASAASSSREILQPAVVAALELLTAKHRFTVGKQWD
jgi:hypothetical protein